MASEMKKGPAGADMIEEINEDFDTFESWVIENWKIIAASCVGIVILVAATGIGMAVHKTSVKKISQQFASADSYDKLTAALKDHPSSSYAPDARMKLAMLQIDK